MFHYFRNSALCRGKWVAVWCFAGLRAVCSFCDAERIVGKACTTQAANGICPGMKVHQCGQDGESYHSQASMAVSADLDLSVQAGLEC